MNKLLRKEVIDRVIALKFEADALPELPPNEKAKLENEIAIDHLYFSSALEGSRLDDEQIRLATHAGVSAA